MLNGNLGAVYGALISARHRSSKIFGARGETGARIQPVITTDDPSSVAADLVTHGVYLVAGL